MIHKYSLMLTALTAPFAKRFSSFKLPVLFLFLLASVAGYGQVTLQASSPYTQDFDSVGSGLPAGWAVYNNVTATTDGTSQSVTQAATAWNNSTNSFKNYASADGLTSAANATQQSNSTDRVIGVKQGTSGAAMQVAFQCTLENTSGFQNFDLTFKLQSLVAANPRIATWYVQYKIGIESWTTVATSPETLTTGNVFSNVDVSVDFGSLLDDKSSNVKIRIYTITAAGSGNGAVSAIDDFVLSYESVTTSDHTITVTQPTGGEITPGTTGVDNGDNQPFTATASDCYTFSHWIIDEGEAGEYTSASNPYAFTNVTTDHTITAVFDAVAPYTITATAGANGSISPNGSISVNCGANQSYSIAPDGGYVVSDVLVNGSSVGAITSYEFTNVTANQTIHATFVEYTGPCLETTFPAATVPVGWGGNSINATTAAHYQSAPNTRQITNAAELISAPVNNPSAISFYVDASGSGGQIGTLEYRVGGVGFWNLVGTFTASTTGNTETFALTSSPNLTSLTDVSFRWTSSANSIYIDDVEVFCTPASPTLEVNPTSLSNFTYIVDNGPSSVQSFTVEGSNLTDDVIITPPANYEISTTNAPFTPQSPITLFPDVNEEVNQTIYVRLQAGLVVGTYNGQEIEITSTDADDGVVTLSGNVTEVVAYGNLQWPQNTAVIEGATSEDIFAQAWHPGLTEAGGAAPGLVVWIGVSPKDAPLNSNPDTWTMWIPAPWHSQQGNNDQYAATIDTDALSLTPGTYRYASQFQLNGGSYTYGGNNLDPGNNQGGNWDGITYHNGTLTINNAIGWANYQSPCAGTQILGEEYLVYGRIWVDGVTSNPGHDNRIDAEVGYSTSNSNPNTWTNWYPAQHNTQYGNNDEYMHNIGQHFTVADTYYMAFRYRLDGGAWYYGGLDSGCDPDAGGEWNGTTNINAVVTITLPPCTAPAVPTSLTFGTITESSISGGFTASGADSYMVVVSTSPTLSNNPDNGTTYSLGANAFLGGTVIHNGTGTTFSATGLDPLTTYYFFVFAYNHIDCTGAPAYSAELTGNETTVSVCVDEDFNSGAPAGWIMNSITYPASGCDGNGMLFNSAGDYAITPLLNNPQTLTFSKRRSNNTTAWTLHVQISSSPDPDSGDPNWTPITTLTIADITTTCQTQTVDLSGYPGYRKVRFIDARDDGTNERFIDNVEIICGSPCTPPAGPVGTITGDTPECNSTTLSFSAPNANFYWQDSADGMSVDNPTTSDYEVYATGTYYVRALDGFCWSDDTVSYAVTINHSPAITTQPVSQIAAQGDNVTFMVVAANAVSYQWQESIDGISWTDISGATGAAYTINNVPLSLDGYRYRVIAFSSDCGTIISNAATINVFDTACIDYGFSQIGSDGWTHSNTTTSSDANHYGNAAPCKGLVNNANSITPAVDNPEFLQFYHDASGAGNGGTAYVEYRINGAGPWLALGTFTMSTAGQTETIDLTNVGGTNLSHETNVTFRFRSGATTWYIDDVKVFCTTCTAPATAAVANPSSGPVGTEVTITGSDFDTNTRIYFNSIEGTILSQTATEIVVTVPVGAASGNILISSTSIPVICDTILPFDVIDNDSSNCQTTFTSSDIFFYEVFDEDQDIDGVGGNWGNGGMLTIFNGTLAPVNLSDYRIFRTATFGSDPYYHWFSPSGLLASGDIFRIRVSGSFCDDYETHHGSVTTGYNANDGFELRKYNPSTGTYETIDQFVTPNYVGYHMLRDLDASLPSATYNQADWAITDIFPGTFPATGTYCVNAGVAPVFNGNLPVINSITTTGSVCDTASITAIATEGYNATSPADTKPLIFEWYYHDGVNDTWHLITTGGDYSIINTIDDVAGTGESTLNVDNIYNKINYQFYCIVREDDASCFTASNAIKLDVDATIWTGTWSNGTPGIGKIVIIDAPYDTSVGGQQTSFEACNLLVRTGTLTIANSTYVEVENNLVVNSTITVNPQGSFKQNNDDGDVIVNTGAVITVEKQTAPMNNWYEYTYWSSPVQGEMIEDALADATPNRRFWFNAQNYLDSYAENNNDNTSNWGQDDIDDNGDDWINQQTGLMLPGVGYASTHRSSLFNSIPCSGGPNCRFVYTFEGPFNNGIYTIPVYRNDTELADNNWNFIGNPYASAISADAFLAQNSTIPHGALEGAIYLWSQNTAPSGTTNGNENLNFAQADYAIINSSGQTAGGDTDINDDPIIPNRFIPSGQGFFVAMSNGATATHLGSNIHTANIVFNNSMRVTGNNNQFFRTAQELQPDKLWVNLTSDNGVFNQILVAYIDGATNAYDGMGYDAPRNLSSGVNSILYSIIPDSDKKFAIQGKNPSSLSINEIIPLGFYTAIAQATIYKLSIAQIEGEFLSNNTVYVKDNLLNLYHDLSSADYHFTSETGEFNDRFEIVFQAQPLGIDDAVLQANNLSIIELANGHVKFTIGQDQTIKNVKIFDIQGRLLYNLKGNNPVEVYNLSNLSRSAYIAKVTLSNGQTVTKRAIKQK